MSEPSRGSGAHTGRARTLLNFPQSHTLASPIVAGRESTGASQPERQDVKERKAARRQKLSDKAKAVAKARLELHTRESVGSATCVRSKSLVVLFGRHLSLETCTYPGIEPLAFYGPQNYNCMQLALDQGLTYHGSAAQLASQLPRLLDFQKLRPTAGEEEDATTRPREVCRVRGLRVRRAIGLNHKQSFLVPWHLPVSKQLTLPLQR